MISENVPSLSDPSGVVAKLAAIRRAAP
jgi:hypothetical protein